jgi:hypothetical protein
MNSNLLYKKMFILMFLTTPSFAAAASMPIQATTNSFGSAVLELQTDELVTMTALPFRLILHDEAGRPVTGAKVDCELSMPAMAMPENRPKIVERDGAYAGEMILTCTMGDWRMACVATQADGHRQTMSFDLGTARLR